jgi:hypothetical protein
MRTAISLYVLETLLAVLAVVPAAGAVTAAAWGLPRGLSLLGTDGPPILADLLVHGGPGFPVGVGASLVALLLVSLFASPLLMAGTVACLGEGDGGGPVHLLMAGARRYPRYLLLHAVYVCLSAGACALLVWLAGPVEGSIGSAALVLALGGVRDVSAAVIRRPDASLRALPSAFLALKEHPASVVGGFLVQMLASWLLCLAAFQVQIAFHGETVATAVAVTAVAQLMMLARCAVRCGWLGMLIRIDS